MVVHEPERACGRGGRFVMPFQRILKLLSIYTFSKNLSEVQQTLQFHRALNALPPLSLLSSLLSRSPSTLFCAMLSLFFGLVSSVIVPSFVVVVSTEVTLGLG